VPAFQLSKWYADCVGDHGDAVILYHAQLRIGKLPIHYGSLLIKEHSAPPRALYSLRRHPAPIAGDHCIEWHSPHWKTRASWRRLGPSHREVLFESDAGALRWNCIAPRCAASVHFGSEKSLHGWGYAEYLELSLAPWRLPIRRLRWGRFVNATDSLVWIDWSGPYTKRTAYFNGATASPGHISDREVVLQAPCASLQLEDSHILRDGLLGETALSVIPRLGDLFPDSIFNVRECKWTSRAVLRRPGFPDSLGTAIHEVVEWP